MAFKLRSSEKEIDNTPIYRVDMEDGVLGMANKNGSILVNNNLSPLKEKEVIKHEMIHVDQIKRGDLTYDDKNVYWKGKKYPRKSMKEGFPKLAWEAEAYKKQKKK
jgi:hypothetical protein